ncbi:hypothetical protein Dda_9346 [Drechslerella dactyloides]|uniref:Uncharacterized protein n=1 Tax=Drechslerella dactyloides TaxID=74499 RepID=A0AAD6IPK7_DREDA|nr:hypothetical protein Dda_9346 [Drechslerella dactyloides]
MASMAAVCPQGLARNSSSEDKRAGNFRASTSEVNSKLALVHPQIPLACMQRRHELLFDAAGPAFCKWATSDWLVRIEDVSRTGNFAQRFARDIAGFLPYCGAWHYSRHPVFRAGQP